MSPIGWIGAAVAAASFAGSSAATDALSTLLASAPTPEKRHALVVGNAHYAHGTLKNPLNDARALARELASSGFEVLLVEDGTQAGMQRAIRRLGDRLREGGVGLFYYAGHGLQVKGRNYLLPVDADVDREYEVEFNAIDVNRVLAMMDAAKNPLNIVILDACRTDPFARSLRLGAAGLAPMDAPTGTFIAFATAPGGAASDGDSGVNGTYTKHLLARIGTPGLPIEQLFKRVRVGVIDETGGQQTPWESSSLRGEFSFRPAQAAPAVEPTVAATLRREREAYRTPSAAPVPGGDAGARQASILSAYLSRQARLGAGMRLPKVAALDEQTCAASYVCSAHGRVVGRETLRLPGGTVETTKVVIQQDWQPRTIEPGASSQNAELWGSRVLTVWYSHEEQRVLRMTSRLVHGRLPPMQANFDLALAGG
jgi:hypothetical protein